MECRFSAARVASGRAQPLRRLSRTGSILIGAVGTKVHKRAHTAPLLAVGKPP